MNRELDGFEQAALQAWKENRSMRSAVDDFKKALIERHLDVNGAAPTKISIAKVLMISRKCLWATMRRLGLNH